MGGQLVGKIRVRIETAEKALDDKEMELLEQIKKSKENQLMRGVNLCSQSQFNKLDKLMNEHKKHKEEEMKSLKSHCTFNFFISSSLSFPFSRENTMSSTRKNTKAQTSLDLIQLDQYSTTTKA